VYRVSTPLTLIYAFVLKLKEFRVLSRTGLLEQHTVRGVFKALRVPIHNDLLRSLLKASVHPTSFHVVYTNENFSNGITANYSSQLINFNTASEAVVGESKHVIYHMIQYNLI